MGFEEFHLSVISDPMVSEANIYSLEQGVVLSDSVLAHYLRTLSRFSPDGSLLKSHALWISNSGIVLGKPGDISQPWKWDDLVKKVDNIGGIDEARGVVEKWLIKGETVAYWTGGLEFTQNHAAVADCLLSKGMKIVLGIEPYTYPDEDKDRGAITEDIVPISFWSRKLGSHGFVFSIPRPRPVGRLELNDFYERLYKRVTNGMAAIVVSESDPHKEQKMKRGKVVIVPQFNYPSTTQLHNSYYA